MDEPCVLSLSAQDCVSLQLINWNCACFRDQKHVKQYKAKMEFLFLADQSNVGDRISKVDNSVGLEAYMTQLKL